MAAPTKQRIALPGGCSISVPSVYPSNWKTSSASCQKDWYIQYRFFDPILRPKGKQRFIQGMNGSKTAAARRADTESILLEDLELLMRGYNPVTGSFREEDPAGAMDESTPLLQALRTAQSSCAGAKYTRDDITSMMHWIPLAIGKLRWDRMPVGQIKTKHIRKILDTCSTIICRLDEKGVEVTAGWSEHKFNKYRSYLMILFSEIIELGGADMNPCRDLRKKKTVRKKRLTLTKAQRQLVDLEIRKKYYYFWRFLHIFFHSGSREIELMAVKGKNVNLVAGTYTRLVKKDRVYREVETPIKDIALPLWRELMGECGPDDFIFSRRMRPGKRIMNPKWIGKIWNKLVKKGLGIAADMYSLKHSNTEETVILVGDQAAAAQNAHRSTAMVVNIYDTGRQDRINEELKKVNNPF